MRVSTAEPVATGRADPAVQRICHSDRACHRPARGAGHPLWAESCRRGLEQVHTLVCVSDGAVWVWALMCICFARRVEVLDGWPAVERLWTLARGSLSGDAAATAWVATQKGCLLQERLRQVVRAVRLVSQGRELARGPASGGGLSLYQLWTHALWQLPPSRLSHREWHDGIGLQGRAPAAHEAGGHALE